MLYIFVIKMSEPLLVYKYNILERVIVDKHSVHLQRMCEIIYFTKGLCL